ncbi:hypothetical protein BDR07DRAFT_1377916 [Suillus spraguei]|nr:hypothetical protein BDR07DRAFT_1377916 [Suillus spraguei]
MAVLHQCFPLCILPPEADSESSFRPAGLPKESPRLCDYSTLQNDTISGVCNTIIAAQQYQSGFPQNYWYSLGDYSTELVKVYGYPGIGLSASRCLMPQTLNWRPHHNVSPTDAKTSFTDPLDKVVPFMQTLSQGELAAALRALYGNVNPIDTKANPLAMSKWESKVRDKLREQCYFTHETPYGTIKTYSDVQLKNGPTAVAALKRY